MYITIWHYISYIQYWEKHEKIYYLFLCIAKITCIVIWNYFIKYRQTLTLLRSSPPEAFLGKCVLKICSKFIGEHPYRSLVSIKLQSNFIEIKLWYGCFLVNLLLVFRTSFPMNTSRWLLLIVAELRLLRWNKEQHWFEIGWQIFLIFINPSVPNAPFIYPLKTSENLTVFWCFQGSRERVYWEQMG